MFLPNKDVIILISKFALVLGCCFGILTPIPYVGFIIFFAMLFFSAPIIMVYLIMAGKYQLSDIKNSIIDGAVIGFSSNFSFSVVYCLITHLLGIIFNYKGNLFLYSMITNSPIWLLIVFILFIGVLVSSINAFSGLSTFYFINLIRDIYSKRNKL